MGVDEHLQLLHLTCKAVLEAVAPLKSKGCKKKSKPWLNDESQCCRQACRQAE